MTETPNLREDLVQVFVETGVDEETARRILGTIPDEKVAETLASFRDAEAEKDALRARLAADPALLRAVCPAPSWRTPHERHDVARRALRLVEAVAEKHDVTVDALVSALIEGRGTVQDTIDTHGDDPRIVQWGSSFYAFRWRLKDAYEVAAKDRLAEERRRVVAAREARWATQGLVSCDRCGGEGGRKDWPGFDCFDCGGRGAVEPRGSRR